LCFKKTLSKRSIKNTACNGELKTDVKKIATMGGRKEIKPSKTVSKNLIVLDNNSFPSGSTMKVEKG